MVEWETTNTIQFGNLKIIKTSALIAGEACRPPVDARCAEFAVIHIVDNKGKKHWNQDFQPKVV
ncbi:MAG: hypothetical protein JSV56_13390 [Methanomassiliicoccales archaeon]|nr:MAG: hypothetical protein JSV56_13390 [Methanomassiliicoccales archaeon]